MLIHLFYNYVILTNSLIHGLHVFDPSWCGILVITCPSDNPDKSSSFTWMWNMSLVLTVGYVVYVTCYKCNVCISLERPNPMKMEQTWNGLYRLIAATATAVILLTLILACLPCCCCSWVTCWSRTRLACAKWKWTMLHWDVIRQKCNCCLFQLMKKWLCQCQRVVKALTTISKRPRRRLLCCLISSTQG